MRCRKYICAACCTRLDGVNHCHACLKELGADQERTRAGRGFGRLPALLLLGVSWLVLFGACWLCQGMLAP
jgi:hypothetical protein